MKATWSHIFLICTLGIGFVLSGSSEEETLTEKEQAQLPQFKKLILPKIPPTSFVNNFIDDDLYVVRWIRARNGDMNQGIRLFTEHLKWREAQNMDTINEEDWSDMEHDFPIYTDGVSKTGQPVSELWFSEWQMRKAVISGKLKRAVRWVAKMFEVESRRLYQARAEGQNVTQAIMLIDTEGFSVMQQACPSCLPVYVGTTSCLENHYPGMYETLDFLNMPSSFDIILRLVRPIMRASTRKTLKVYPSKSQWMPLLDAKMDKDQRSVRLGGTVLRPDRS